MKTDNKQIIDLDKLKKVSKDIYKNLIEFKKYKKTPLVVSENGKVVFLDPYEAEKRLKAKK